MSVNQVQLSTAVPQQKTVKVRVEHDAGDKKSQVDDFGLNKAKGRQRTIAKSMLEDDSEKANSNGNWSAAPAAGGVGAALAVIGSVASGFFTAGVGWIVGGIAACLGGGAVGSVVLGNASADYSTKMNEDMNLYRATGEEIDSPELGAAAEFWSNNALDNNALPDEERIREYADNLTDSEYGDGSTISFVTIYNNRDEDSDEFAEVRDITIDSSKFNSQNLDDTGVENERYAGYTENVITMEKRFGDVVETFSESLNNELTDDQRTRLIEMSNALSTKNAYTTSDDSAKPKEDIDFFDINGDGLINLLDVHSLDNLTPGSKKEEILKIESEWSTDSLSKSLGMTKEEVSVLYDLNYDGYVDDKDKEIWHSEFDSPKENTKHAEYDINLDGRIDSKDLQILRTYIGANMQRITDIEEEKEGISDITFGKNNEPDDVKRTAETMLDAVSRYK